MKVINKTILNIALVTVLGVSASLANNPLGLDEETMTKTVIKAQIASDIVKATDINPAETVGKVGTLWSGLKGTASGLWGFGKAYTTAVYNTYSLYGNAAKTVAGAAASGIGYVTGYDALQDMGSNAVSSATSSMKATVKTVPGNMKDLIETGIESGKAGYAVYKVGKELEEDYKVIQAAATLAMIVAAA